LRNRRNWATESSSALAGSANSRRSNSARLTTGSGDSISISLSSAAEWPYSPFSAAPI
jgi:hypothetical protein